VRSQLEATPGIRLSGDARTLHETLLLAADVQPEAVIVVAPTVRERSLLLQFGAICPTTMVAVVSPDATPRTVPGVFASLPGTAVDVIDTYLRGLVSTFRRALDGDAVAAITSPDAWDRLLADTVATRGTV
jgi:hypothetical protein